jgi:hypothetical protein
LEQPEKFNMMLDKFESVQPEVLSAMLSLGKIRKNIKHIDLGSGDGQVVNAAKLLGANSWGIEIDPILAGQSRQQYGITVINEDCFNSDVSRADVITCWFTLLPQTTDLIEKLKREMKTGSMLIKGGYTTSSWGTVWISNTPFRQEVYQGQKVYRVDGEIVCTYIK